MATLGRNLEKDDKVNASDIAGISYTLKQDLLAPGEQGKMRPLLRCATKPAILGARDTGIFKIIKSEVDVLLREAYSLQNVNQISR